MPPFTPVPTAPPTNLTIVAVTAQTFTASWSPPPFEMQNGLIQQYVIVVTGTESGHTFQTTSNTTEVTVMNLRPFTTYTCKVAAETVGIGPYTSPITVQLLEDGESLYNETCSDISYSVSVIMQVHCSSV